MALIMLDLIKAALQGLVAAVTRKKPMAMNLQQLADFAKTNAATRVVSKSTLVSNNYVPESPESLAAQAGVDLTTYTLARMMRSEGYDHAGPAPQTKIMTAIIQGQTAISAAGGASKLFNKLTHNGLYGRQGSWVGYAATTSDPTALDIEIAKSVLAGTVPPYAVGGTNFLSPWRPGATQAGKPLGDFIGVITAWARDGRGWIGPVPGLDSFRFMAFKRMPVAEALSQLEKAKIMYNRGLNGDHRPEPFATSALATSLQNLTAGPGGTAAVALLFIGAAGILLYRRLRG